MSGAAARGGNGFTLIELLVATAIFLVICGAIFELLELVAEKL